MGTRETAIEKVYVISHTHWDREWYQDFQGYRVRLVYMIDELLEKMEQDPAYRFYMMDGQTIVLDDYLEIRPENRERLGALIRQGRIKIGPWYVMPDEFLVSGESLIRNLLAGFTASRSWGVEPLKSGYIPDIFGHNSQFPQILRGFGIDNAVLFRGFHGDGDPSEIWWEGVDGSRVLGLKLDEDRSYGDFYFFLRWPFTERDFQYEEDELVERAQAMLDYKAKRATTGIIAGFDGIDHIEIEPQLPWMLRTLNESRKLDAKFVHTHLEAYMDDLRERIGELQVYRGEQRTPGYNGINNWVLANVLSSRIHLKQCNHACETLLEQWAEPWGMFAALEGRSYPQSLLNKSWQFLLQNHPHDSICGCSIDQVHQDMIYRFDQSRLISEQMVKEQLDFFSNHLSSEALNGQQAFTVFNPSQSAIDGIVEVEIALPAGTDAAVTMTHLGGTSFRIFDHQHREVPYQLLEIKRNSTQKWRPYRDIPHGDLVDRYRIALHANVPGFGYAAYRLEKFTLEGPRDGEYSASKMMTAPLRNPGSMQINADTWDNGRIRLQVRADGTIDIADHMTGRSYEGLLLLEDEADIGEGWNHVVPFTNEVFKSIGSQAVISVVSDGPYLTRIRIRTSIRVPASIETSETRRSEALVDIPVCTYIDLRKDDPVVRCRTVVQNTAKDHRLRLLFPTGLRAEHFHTSTPFDLVKRSIQPPDYSRHLEKARDIVPHNGIVAMEDGSDGLAIYSKGLYEVAARNDEARTIALTLFRSTGKEVLCDGSDGGQLLRELEFHYAIRPFGVDKVYPSALWQEQRQFAGGIRSIDRKAGKVRYETLQRRTADLPPSKSFLTVDSPDLIVSAVKQSEHRPGHMVVRLFNVTDRAASATLTFDRALRSVGKLSLDEQLVADLPAEGSSVGLEAGPRQIVTIEVGF